MNIINRFEIPYYQVLNDQVDIIDTTASCLQDQETLLALYRYMVLIRVLDTKAIALQRTGKLGTYPSTKGQEAVFVGVGRAMQERDIFVPYYRDIGTLMQRGVKASQILAYWGGDERGNAFGDYNFPYSVPVGSQPLYAAGAAFALKYQKVPQAVLVMCGEGGTSQGDFYEAMNVAGAWSLPIVFVVCNNQWAISVSRDAQTKAETIAQKAIAAGFSGEQIDGNDALAVYDRTYAALERARQFQPSLLEMVCYRQSDHTTADDASRYEPRDRRESEWMKEPITRLKQYLVSKNWWSASQDERLLSDCAQEVDQAVEEYLQMQPQPLTSIFDHLYETLPACYQEQRAILASMEAARSSQGDQHG